jgi:cytochrome c biogenesis protein CcmG/thiol:disulfide interchange protein DsbE
MHSDTPDPQHADADRAVPTQEANTTPTSPSRGRWIMAAAATLAVGVFAIPLLLGNTGKNSSNVVADGAVGSSGSCPAKSGDANLNFTLHDMNGTPVKLSEFKGKVIVLNYWATWCGPCKIEIPAFVELYDKYKNDGLVILGVSGDDDPETLRAFAKEWKMNYPVLVGRDHEILDAFGPLWGYPTTFMIGRDGSVCGKHLGPASKDDFEREIKALL